MSERVLTLAVQAEAKRLGLLHHWCPDSRRCSGTPGLPDLLLLGPGGIMLAELKDKDGDTSASQDAWLYMLHQAGIPHAVWRPENWDSGAIWAAMKAIAG